MTGGKDYEHRLSGIAPTSAAGWLATLGLLGVCTNVDPGGNVALRWDEEIGLSIPVLRCRWDKETLINEVLAVLKKTGEWVKQSVWSKLTISGDCAAELLTTSDILHRAKADDESLLALFCRRREDSGELALSRLLGGVSAKVRVKNVVEGCVGLLDEKDIDGKDSGEKDLCATLYGPWKPKVGNKEASFGFDWMTVSDGASANGEAGSLPSRDLLALLGSTWIAGAPKRDLLVWGCWSRWMGSSDVAVLATRPELWRVGQLLSEQGEGLQKEGVDPAVATLRAWSVTQVMVSRSILRGMNPQSKYRLWEEAKVVDLRALR